MLRALTITNADCDQMMLYATHIGQNLSAEDDKCEAFRRGLSLQTYYSRNVSKHSVIIRKRALRPANPNILTMESQDKFILSGLQHILVIRAGPTGALHLLFDVLRNPLTHMKTVST